MIHLGRAYLNPKMEKFFDDKYNLPRYPRVNEKNEVRKKIVKSYMMKNGCHEDHPDNAY